MTTDPCLAPLRRDRGSLRAADRTLAFASLLVPVETLRDLAASFAPDAPPVLHFTHYRGDAWYGVMLDGAAVLLRGVIQDAPGDTDLRWCSTALRPYLATPLPGTRTEVEALQLFLDAIPLATEPPVPERMTVQYGDAKASVPALLVERILRRLEAQGPCRFGVFTLAAPLATEPCLFLALGGEGWRVFVRAHAPDPTAPRFDFNPKAPAFVACATCGRVAGYAPTEADAFTVAEARGYRDIVLATVGGRVTASHWQCTLHHDAEQAYVSHGGAR